MHGIGWTPLFVAAYGRHASVVAALLAHGAGCSAITTAEHWSVPAGTTALQIAERQGHAEVAALLR